MTEQDSAHSNSSERLEHHSQSTKDALRRFGLSQLSWEAQLAELMRARAAGEATSDILAALRRSESRLPVGERVALRKGLYEALKQPAKAKVPA